MCISPSPYNGSETAFTVDFGERFSHLSANPIPSELIKYDEILSKTKKFIEENISNTSKKQTSMQERITNTVAAKKTQLEFLKSLVVEEDSKLSNN